MEYLDTAFSLLAEQSPIIFFCALAFWIQARAYNKSMKQIKDIFEISLSRIQENYNMTLGIIKDNNISIFKKIKEK